MFSRYLYSKVQESKTKSISLFLDANEINFLKQNRISFLEESKGIYSIDCDKLRMLFCH